MHVQIWRRARVKMTQTIVSCPMKMLVREAWNMILRESPKMKKGKFISNSWQGLSNLLRNYTQAHIYNSSTLPNYLSTHTWTSQSLSLFNHENRHLSSTCPLISLFHFHALLKLGTSYSWVHLLSHLQT